MVHGDHLRGFVYPGSWAPCCVTRGASSPVWFTNAPIHISVMLDCPIASKVPPAKNLGPVYSALKNQYFNNNTADVVLSLICCFSCWTNKAKGGGVGVQLAIIIWQSSHKPDFISACQLCDVVRVMEVIRLHTLGFDWGVLVGLLCFLLSNKLSSYWHDCWTCHTPPALLHHPAEIRCKGLDPSQALDFFSVSLVLHRTGQYVKSYR